MRFSNKAQLKWKRDITESEIFFVFQFHFISQAVDLLFEEGY